MRTAITTSLTSRWPTSSPASPELYSPAGGRSKLKRPPRSERPPDIGRDTAAYNSPRLRAGTRTDGLTVDRRSENLGGSMSCRRRRIYEDRDAQISILAPEPAASDYEAGYIAAGCQPSLHNPPCRHRAGHTLNLRPLGYEPQPTSAHASEKLNQLGSRCISPPPTLAEPNLRCRLHKRR